MVCDLRMRPINRPQKSATLLITPNCFTLLLLLLLSLMSDQVAKRVKMEGGSVNEVQEKSTSPKKICDLSTQKFSEIVDFEAFVDKTLFIKAFLQAGSSVIAALAPRRFGKSTNMDMVKEFVKGNKKLFEDNRLKICTEERVFFDKYCQENPVIHVDLKSVRGNTNDEVLQTLKELIHCAFNEHRYLIQVAEEKYSWSNRKLEDMAILEAFEKYWKGPENLTECNVILGLKYLSQCLHVYHGKPVYVFIDEYDSPITHIIMDTCSEAEVLNETISVINSLMSILLKGNEHIEKALINASFCIQPVSSGDANNIQYYEFLGRPTFSPYFGFTDKEVGSLFKRDEFAELKNDQVKEWYNGYRSLYANEYTIYSSCSVLQYLKRSKIMNKPQFETYWVDCITNLKELFAETEIRRLIESLIDGVEVEIKRIKNFTKEDIITLQHLVHQKLNVVGFGHAHLFLQFLTKNGYFNVVSTGYHSTIIQAPNNEIKMLLKQKCYDAELFQEKYQLSPANIIKYVDALESLLQHRDDNAFIRFAKAVSELFDGAVMPKCEYEFHSFLFTLAYNIKKFKVHSELSVQRKKRKETSLHLDMVVILCKVGVILELKFEDESSEEAHAQIQTEEYETAFVNYNDTTEKILIGVHMNNERKVSLTYTVNKSSKQTVTSND